MDNVPARVAQARRPLEAAPREDRTLPAGEVRVSLPIEPPFPPMAALLVGEIPVGRRVAVRAQVGRLPVPRLRDGDRGRAPVQGGSAARALFPGSRRRRGPPGRRRASSWTARSSSPSARSSLSTISSSASIRPRAASASSRRSTPALYVVFDLLVDEKGRSLVARPLEERRRLLEAFARRHFGDGRRLPALAGRPRTLRAAGRWLRAAGRSASTASWQSGGICRIPLRATGPGMQKIKLHAHRGLRGRRLSLRVEGSPSSARFSSACTTTYGQLAPRRLLLEPQGGAEERAPDAQARVPRQAAGFHRPGAGRSQPVVAPSGPATGSRSLPSSSSRSSTTTSPADASVTARSFSGWRPDKPPQRVHDRPGRAGEPRLSARAAGGLPDELKLPSSFDDS